MHIRLESCRNIAEKEHNNNNNSNNNVDKMEFGKTIDKTIARSASTGFNTALESSILIWLAAKTTTTTKFAKQN